MRRGYVIINCTSNTLSKTFQILWIKGLSLKSSWLEVWWMELLLTLEHLFSGWIFYTLIQSHFFIIPKKKKKTHRKRSEKEATHPKSTLLPHTPPTKLSFFPTLFNRNFSFRFSLGCFFHLLLFFFCSFLLSTTLTFCNKTTANFAQNFHQFTKNSMKKKFGKFFFLFFLFWKCNPNFPPK